MDNETFKPDPTEEEYHFSPEGETTNAFTATDTTADAAKTNVVERLKRKNILIVLGVIVVAFSVYKLFDVLLATHVTPHEPATPVVATPAFPTAAQLAPTATSATPAPALPQASVVTNSRLSDLESKQAEYQAGLDKLNSQMNEIQSSLTSMDAQLSSLSTSVQTLATQFAAQQAEVAAAKQAAEKRLVQRKARPVIKPVYYVRSMIPGRAWLATGDGGTVTVSVGDNLPGYGVVQVIDPVQGTLTTSAGAIIGFSPGDS